MARPKARRLRLYSRGRDNYFALVDAEDLERCLRHRWLVDDKDWKNKKVYARAGKSRVFLQHFVLDSPMREHIYFVNGNHFDCRKANLKCKRLNPEDMKKFEWLKTKVKRYKKPLGDTLSVIQEIDWEAKNGRKEKNLLGLPKDIFQPVAGPEYNAEQRGRQMQITPRREGFNRIQYKIEKSMRRKAERVVQVSEERNDGND